MDQKVVVIKYVKCLSESQPLSWYLINRAITVRKFFWGVLLCVTKIKGIAGIYNEAVSLRRLGVSLMSLDLTNLCHPDWSHFFYCPIIPLTHRNRNSILLLVCLPEESQEICHGLLLPTQQPTL